ncbi:hypothetical protein [Solicola gregarius]|uniref:Uncharacterized protein n=1 Tax=Solicola gregarius TaxID=2908642 RepID=A0AA46TF73_9ACTN|nr:hypothetical protein [Solicola gregarius]UYM04216.1 hypothetical protein L0C25_16925 [Solicola gregarius]
MTAPTEQVPPSAEGVLFQQYADSLATMAERAGVALLAQWIAGALSDMAWQTQLARLFIRVNRGGTVVADLYAARQLRLMGIDASPLGLSLPDDVAEVQRLTKAVTTLSEALDDPESLEPRVVRVARSEPVNAMQQGVVRAYAEHGVGGYRRGLDADPCPLCQWLYKDGYVYPGGTPFHRHPGCQCEPVPVTA